MARANKAVTTYRAVAGLGVAVVVVVAATPVQRESLSHSALAAFEQRVEEYAGLHRRLEAGLPPLETATNPDRFITHRKELVAAIKTARPNGRRGDFFDRSAGLLFRSVIADALYGLDVEGLLIDLFEEHPKTWGFKLGVYDSYPGWATREMPGLLLQRLPALPEELEYRIIDHDLAILDADAGLVLDVLPLAIPQAGS